MYTDIIRIVPEEKPRRAAVSAPQVGMFWWNPKQERFVLTVKMNADNISIDDNGEATLPFSFEEVWHRHRMRGDYRKIPHGRVVWNGESYSYYANVVGLEDTDLARHALLGALGKEFHLEAVFDRQLGCLIEPTMGDPASARLMACVRYGFSRILSKFFKNKDSNLMLFAEVDDILKGTADEIEALLNRHFKDRERYRELCPNGVKKYKNIFKRI